MSVQQQLPIARLDLFHLIAYSVVPIFHGDFIRGANHTDLQVLAHTSEPQLGVINAVVEPQQIRIAGRCIGVRQLIGTIVAGKQVAVIASATRQNIGPQPANQCVTPRSTAQCVDRSIALKLIIQSISDTVDGRISE